MEPIASFGTPTAVFARPPSSNRKVVFGVAAEMCVQSSGASPEEVDRLGPTLGREIPRAPASSCPTRGVRSYDGTIRSGPCIKTSASILVPHQSSVERTKPRTSLLRRNHKAVCAQTDDRRVAESQVPVLVDLSTRKPGVPTSMTAWHRGPWGQGFAVMPSSPWRS